MAARLLNDRLYALLPRDQYATMIYLLIDPKGHRAVWCGAGGPPPIFVSAAGLHDMASRGLPLGVRAGTVYQRRWTTLPTEGILALSSDGLFESGANSPDVPREAIANALAGPVRLASTGRLTAAAEEATQQLAALRDLYPCSHHADDAMAICIAFGSETGMR